MTWINSKELTQLRQNLEKTRAALASLADKEGYYISGDQVFENPSTWLYDPPPTLVERKLNAILKHFKLEFVSEPAKDVLRKLKRA